jgi:nucleoprotein TPR
VEKSALEAAKVDAEKKVKELDKQNQLLLDRLEGVHIVAAETERKAAGILSDSGQFSEVVGESDLQNVIRYLRRSKETVDTELSLMKQERIRLQKQLEAAYHAAEEAQASLRREHESARASFYTDEEFRTLQAQVRELNLLRESNAELREENRRNFEDCREWRDKAREAQAELEPVRKLLREKEVELEASGRTLDIHKQETLRWEKRVKQLLEKYRAVDVDDYQRVKDELAAIQKHDQETVAELVVTKKEVEVLKVTVNRIEEERETKGSRLVELEARVTELDQKLQEAVQSEV